MTGSGRDSLLEIGLSRQWDPTTGYYAVIRAPRGSLQPESLRVDADQRLLDGTGAAIIDYPYLVFSIQARRDRPNWFEIGELRKAYDALNTEVQRGRFDDVTEAFAVFRRTALTSPDLLFDDAKAIADKVNAQVKEAMSAMQTASQLPGPLPELRTFTPFAGQQ